MLENFPAGKHDDEVDALSGAHGIVCATGGGFTSADIHEMVRHMPPADPLGLFSISGASRLGPEDF